MDNNKLRAIKVKAFFFSSWILIFWGLLVPDSAYAYIDPGIGPLLWQLLLAGIFGVAFFIHKIRQWIWNQLSAMWKFFSSRKNSTDI